MRNLLLLFISLIFLSCGSSDPDVAGGVETGNGFVVGIAYASDNEPIVTTVSLVPTDFNPVSDEVDTELTYTTSADGEYEISAEPGTYNVVAFSPESKETALIRSVVVKKQQRHKTNISLVEIRECLLSLDGKNSSAGSFYFEGTLSSAKYDANAESARFDDLPNIATLPALYQYEDGTRSNIVDEFEFNEAETYEISGGKLIVGNSIVASSLRGTDGFENFTTLHYDNARRSFWAGTKSSGLFRFDDMGVAVKRWYNPITHQDIERAISHIQVSSTGDLFLGTKIGVVAYDFQEDLFNRIDTDIDSLPVIDLGILSSGSLIAAYRTGVAVGDTLLSVPELSAMVNDENRIYAGTASGNVFAYDMETLEQTLLPASFSAVKDLAITKDGKVLVVTAEGISIIANGEVERLDFFANRNILSIEESSTGELYVLTGNSGLYKIDLDLNIVVISGFEELLPETTTGTKFTLSDFVLDELDNIYLLVVDGAIIKIEN